MNLVNAFLKMNEGVLTGNEDEAIDVDNITNNNDKECAVATIAGGDRVLSTKFSDIMNTPREKSILETIKSMGIPVKINKMNNVVASVKDMQEAGAVLQTIFKEFGVRGSFMITWSGNGKLYFDPRTPVDRATALEYAKAHKMPLPSSDPQKYIGY